MFGEVYSDIPQPEDRGILLKDILEDEVDEKYYLSDKGISGMLKHKENNTNNGNGFGVQFITRETDKSNSILQRGYKDCKDNALCVAQRGRDNGQNLEPNYTEKTNCLTSVQKDNLVLQINPSKESGGKQPYQHNRVYNTNGISPCLNTDARAPSILTIKDYKIRRLTPTECSRLQTIPEWYRWECSDTQAYRMLGNGWNIETIVQILKFMK